MSPAIVDSKIHLSRPARVLGYSQNDANVPIRMIVIALGGNLISDAGPPEATIAAALAELALRGIRPVRVSPMYASQAWPDPHDPPYANAVARLETSLSPETLMREFEAVEAKFGRIRARPNAPRTLDIDLLDYNGLVRELDPTLPHPRME